MFLGTWAQLFWLHTFSSLKEDSLSPTNIAAGTHRHESLNTRTTDNSTPALGAGGDLGVAGEPACGHPVAGVAQQEQCLPAVAQRAHHAGAGARGVQWDNAPSHSPPAKCDFPS